MRVFILDNTMKCQGFSLIELLFVVFLMSSLFLLSTSGLSSLRQKNEAQVLVNELTTAIQYAKMQTIRMGHPLVLMPLHKNANWAQGMVLQPQHKEEVLYTWYWHHPHWTITWSGVHSDKKIILSNNPVSAISNGSFLIYNDFSQDKKVLILNRLGRIDARSRS